MSPTAPHNSPDLLKVKISGNVSSSWNCKFGQSCFGKAFSGQKVSEVGWHHVEQSWHSELRHLAVGSVRMAQQRGNPGLLTAQAIVLTLDSQGAWDFSFLLQCICDACEHSKLCGCCLMHTGSTATALKVRCWLLHLFFFSVIPE